MTSPKKPRLHLARAQEVRRPSLSLVKKALRLYRGRGVPKATYRANAIRWLKAMESLGDRHILNKAAPAKWGRAGEPKVEQIHAPRRLGESQ